MPVELTRSRKLANLATAIDSASSGSILKKGTEQGEYVSVSLSDASGVPTFLDSSSATTIIDSSYIQARQSGGGGTAFDSSTLTSLVDSNYITSRFSNGNSGFKLYRYNATAGQTTFQDSDRKGNILSYTVGGVKVFYNGVSLLDTEFTADDGSSVVLDSAASLNAKIQIAKWNVPSSGGGGGATWFGSRGILWGGNYTDGVGSQVGFEIDYITIATPGNAASFGDLLYTNSNNPGSGSLSDGTYGVYPTKTESDSTLIQYITVATTGNAQNFGDLTTQKRGHGTASNGTLGLMAGGRNDAGIHNEIDYITIATPGNATSSGTLSKSKWSNSGVSNGTLGMFGGGYDVNASGFSANVDYVTIATSGNGTSWGNLTLARTGSASCDDGTYGVWMAGNTGTQQNLIDYLTIATSGSASDFGDLTVARYYVAGASNGTTGICAGGTPPKKDVIDYITIATPGNATDFGNLSQAVEGPSGCSGT